MPATTRRSPRTSWSCCRRRGKLSADGTRDDDGGETERIGPYRILTKLGEGGMGAVYLAEQRQPLRRRVALKVLKQGMDSRAFLARFEVERQALAMMEHSCIARVYDAGIGEKGQPYLAMEYVKGVPITDYCDQNKLSIAQRLDLFVAVCSAVQHAHTKGVMHRDLKPSNILVTVQDGKAEPKVIDFGLAKALDHRIVESTVFTETGQIIGTPAYMSPEQAGVGGLDIDTRTDVFSLGVLLYQLLSGALPVTREELLRHGYYEMQRVIRDEGDAQAEHEDHRCRRDRKGVRQGPKPAAQRAAEAASRRPGLDRHEVDREGPESALHDGSRAGHGSAAALAQ